MFIDTSSWGWPQWVVIVFLLLDMAMHAANHGKPRLDPQDKTQPQKYNGFVGFTRLGIFAFFLAAGGFFA